MKKLSKSSMVIALLCAAGVQAQVGVLQGTVTGRYEDLRRFLYNLESAEELLFIEDLNLVRSGNVQDQQLTFNIRISTYLRGEHLQPPKP